MSRANAIVGIFEEENRDRAAKIVDKIEAKMKRKLSEEEREKLLAKFIKNMKSESLDAEIEECVKELEEADKKKKESEEGPGSVGAPYVKSPEDEEDDDMEDDDKDDNTTADDDEGKGKKKNEGYQSFCESNKINYR